MNKKHGIKNRKKNIDKGLLGFIKNSSSDKNVCLSSIMCHWIKHFNLRMQPCLFYMFGKYTSNFTHLTFYALVFLT